MGHKNIESDKSVFKTKKNYDHINFYYHFL